MKILITCIHYPVASGRYIARAFQRLGHEVKTVGPSTGAEVWGMKIEEKYIWQPDPPPDGWQPDLIIHADSSDQFLPTRCNGAPLVLWAVDNHARDYAFADWDQMFLAHSWGARMAEPNAHWLPPCFDPKAHTDQHASRYIDAAMIGAIYPDRREIVEKISALGLHIVAGTGALWAEYNAIYNGAKIAICKSVAGDIPLRVFENMAQGCCVLADYMPDLIKLGFVPYEDFWLFNGADDAAQSARWLIESGEWQRIAANGQRKAQPHTWDNRAKQLLKTMEMSQ